MTYDMYNDPLNPVRKSGKADLGSGNGGGNFEYGSGGREIAIVPPEEGVCEGTGEMDLAVKAWNPDPISDHGPGYLYEANGPGDTVEEDYKERYNG